MKKSNMKEASVKTESIMDAAKAILKTSSNLLLVGEGEHIHVVSELEPVEVVEALKANRIVKWGDWTIRATPGRAQTDEEGNQYWISSVWVSSSLGFNTFVWKNAASANNIVSYILDKEELARENGIYRSGGEDGEGGQPRSMRHQLGGRVEAKTATA